MMNFKPITKHNLWRNLEPITNSRGRLYEDWAKLFEEFPERFMVGTDEKFGRQKKGRRINIGARYEKVLKRMRKMLGSLDPNSAKMIAHKNAERIFN